jgi:NAD+ diphosphatase
VRLPDALAGEVAALVDRLGPTAFVAAPIPDGLFEPVSLRDRIGEVCMVVRRPSGRLITFRKEFYPPGVMRLLTGGVKPGEAIEAALLREVAEETGLDVAVRQLLAVIGYSAPGDGPDGFSFFSFAFLLDELGGELASHDPDERLEAFGEAWPHELPALAAFLEQLEAREDRAISGSWRTWGRFRAVVHRVVAAQLGDSP